MEHNEHVDLLRPAGLAAGGTWADLGAGAGAFTLALRELVGPQADIYAVDRDRARLGELERSAASYRGSVPTFLANEIASLRARIAGRPNR